MLEAVGLNSCDQTREPQRLGQPYIQQKGVCRLGLHPYIDQGISERAGALTNVPWEFAVSGAVDILDKRLGEANFKITGNGTVKAGVKARAAFGDIASIEGEIEGAFYPSGFNIEGRINACIAITFCAGADGVFSTTGVGACVSAPFGSIGFGYIWATKELNAMGGSCSISRYRFNGMARTAQLRQAGAGAGAQQLVVKPGQPLLLVKATGTGAIPKVRLRGPDGTVLESPAKGGVVGKLGDNRVLIEDPRSQAVHLQIIAPAAGTWTVEPLGSSRIKPLETADVIPPATLKAKVVSGAGRERFVEYAYEPQADTQIDFVEEGGPSGVAARIGRVKPSPCTTKPATPAMRCGRLRFTPAQGEGGRRKVVAQISRYGLPVENRDVTSYDAPGRALPFKVKRVRIDRRRGRIVIGWSVAKNTTEYEVAVRTSGGLGVLRTRSARCRVVRISGIGPRTRVTVSVTPKDAAGQSGPVTKSVLGTKMGKTRGKKRKGDGSCR